MLHQDCTEARRLLDTYLMALSIAGSAKRSSGQVTPREERDAKDTLVTARQRYWTHVIATGAGRKAVWTASPMVLHGDFRSGGA